MTRLAPYLLVIYSLLLAIALLSPSSTDQNVMVFWLIRRLQSVGVHGPLVQFARMEVLMNVLIIAPVTLLASFVRPSLTWRDWTAFGFAASCVVEIVQGTLLVGRHASFSDIVANTAGACLGAVIARLAWVRIRTSSRDRLA